ncbi:MAG: hypothetical protein HC803_01100 [Saprospiraceae bacterium]|nr:hypothetical protein [Saprospiraceae bacterium]
MVRKATKKGFNPQAITMFLWEEVTPYLSEEEVYQMMTEMKMNSKEGSILIADFYAEEFIKEVVLREKKKSGNKLYELPEIDFVLNFSKSHKTVFNTFLEKLKMTALNSHFIGNIAKDNPFMVVAEIKL